MTSELARVVISEAAGAPELAWPEPMAPMAPAPLAPLVSTPVKLTTVIEEETLCDKVAVTVTLLNGVGAKARQISVSPFWVLVRATGAQTNPAPLTLFTTGLVPRLSVATSASSSSLPAEVENAEVAGVVVAAP